MFRLIKNYALTGRLCYTICEDCGHANEFKGVFSPVICDFCDEVLEDAVEMDTSVQERIHYHTDDWY
jgi:hypothetical protein